MGTFFLRVVLVAAGVVFAASLAIAFTVVAAGWLLGAGWARLTGRPVRPLTGRFRVRDRFDAAWRRAAGPSRTPRADAVASVRRGSADIVDVEPK